MTKLDHFEGDMRGLIDHYLAENDLVDVMDEMDLVAGRLESIAEELREDEYDSRSGVPYRHLDPDDAHGRFGGNEHYQLIQMALHRVINRYYEKNSRISVENESLSFRSSLGSSHFSSNNYSEKELHPDIYVEMEPGEAGMKTSKTVLVECETTKRNLLANGLRMAAYNLLREGNPDTNELMIYIALPKSLEGSVEKPDWANDLWFFETQD